MILIALGANQNSRVGPPEVTFRAALSSLAGRGVNLAALSRVFSSPAWPDPLDPPFTNAVAVVETALTPGELMAVLHAVEAELGRERRVPNAPRTLDLDLIDYDGRVQSPPGGPILPHPRAAERAFVLAPLLDVAPDWRDPVSGQAGQELLKAAQALGNQAIPANIKAS